MTSVLRPKLKTAQDIKVRPNSAVARKALSIDASGEVVDLVGAHNDNPLKATQLGILESPTSKSRPKSAVTKSEKVLQDLFPYLAQLSPKPLIEDYYPGITSSVTPGKIRPSSSPGVRKKDEGSVSRDTNKGQQTFTFLAPSLSRKPPIERQLSQSDHTRKQQHRCRPKSSGAEKSSGHSNSGSRGRGPASKTESNRDRHGKYRDPEREKRHRERRRRERRRQEMADILHQTDEYGLALNPKEKKLLPTYHHLAKLEDDEAENEKQMKEFDKKKVRGHNALRDPNAPEKTIFPSRYEKKRFNQSFKYGDDEVTVVYPPPETARSAKTEISDVSAFRVTHHHPNYSAQQPMKMPAADGVTWKLSKASWDDAATISSHGSASVNTGIVEPKKVVSELTKSKKKSEYQEKYDEIKTLSMYKNFKEAYDEPPRNVNIQRERQILTSLFFATEGYKWNKDITHKMTCMDQPWCGEYPHMQWHGVTTAPYGAADGLEGLVIELNLRKRNLRGLVPLSLGKLVHLEMLDLSYNKLYGEIPVDLVGRMKSLVVLSLENNKLSGRIHHSLFISLPNLLELWLSNNQLTGSIPDITIEMNCNLTHLCLANNNLTGEIPPAMAYLTSLECLTLGCNHLSGEVPSGLFKLTRLTQLSMHNNMLTGEYPLFLEKLPKIRELHLFHNQFDVRPVHMQQPVYNADGSRRDWYTVSEQKIPIDLDQNMKEIEVRQLIEMGNSTGLIHSAVTQIKDEMENKQRLEAAISMASRSRRTIQRMTEKQQEELELAQIENASFMSKHTSTDDSKSSITEAEENLIIQEKLKRLDQPW